MKQLLFTLINMSFICMLSYSQRIPQVPDSIRKNYKVAQANSFDKSSIDYSLLNKDSLIKIKLIKLALINPAMQIADANNRIAESELARAKMSWLGSINAGANVNEFVIEGSPASNFFPKYNIGVSVPFDILSRLKRDKKVARENITISTELKKEREQLLKAQVLMAYENYKEKKEMVFLQKSSIEYDFSAYEASQTSYAEGDVTLEEMNKTHQLYLNERAKLVSKEKEFNVAIIQLEQLVGVPLSEAFKIP